jgi:hypothetical protein
VNATGRLGLKEAAGLDAQDVEGGFEFGDGVFQRGMLVELSAKCLQEIAGFYDVLGCVGAARFI